MLYSGLTAQSISNPDSMLGVSNQMLAEGRLTGDNGILASGYLLKGRIYLKYGSYDTALMYCDSGIMKAEASGLDSLQAELLVYRGNALFFSQGPESAIGTYKESYRLYSKAGDSAGLTRALNGLGVMYKKLAQYDSALTYYIRLVTLAERNGYEKELGMGYVNLGILYQDLEDHEKAFHYLDLSIPINEKYRPDLVALAHMNVGLIYYVKAEYDSALVELRIALRQYIPLNSKKSLADVLNNIGNVYLDSEVYDSALYYFNKARALYITLKDWYTLGQVYNNLGLLQIERGNIDHALIILDSCISMASSSKNAEVEARAYMNKYYAFTKKGDYKNALENYLIHDSIENVIYNLEKDKVMADLEMKYQSEKKQAQILTMEKESLQKDLALQIKTRQKNIFQFTGLGIISIMTFAFLYFRQRTLKDRIIAEQRIRQLEEEKKLLAARSLVEGQEEERKRIARELHDGLGVLLSTTKMQFSALHDSSPENRQLIDRATRLLEQAANDVRKISHNMMPGLLTRLGLYEAVSDLFEKLSETEGLTVRADIPEDAARMAENKEIMIYRIIQEMVNNTLKHSGAKNIEIQMQLLPGYLDIIYSDDGKGFDVEEKVSSKSIGLSSIQSRINFLNGKMELHSEPGRGVSYKFEIPL